MSSYTADDLANLKKAYARGVLEVREGNDWLKFQSAAAMRKAIEDIEAELAAEANNTSKPSGMRVTQVMRPYHG